MNRLSEATAIHWHGMELESYYDGVHGWGRPGTGDADDRAGQLVCRPLHAAEHRHVHVSHAPPRYRQLTSGLYGAMIVVEPGATFDETTDHVLVLGRGGPQPGAPVVINNARAPEYVWKAGARHRLRLINITPDDIVSVALMSGDAPKMWRPLTKDGAPVPSESRSPVTARQVIGVGETYDFEIELPPGRGNLWLEVRTTGGRWHTQGRVIVR